MPRYARACRYLWQMVNACASAVSTVLCRSVVTVTVVSSAPKASWVVMNNHAYNAMQVRQSTCKALDLVSCLGAKGTTQTLLEMLVGLLKKCCCHKKHSGCMGCAAV